METQFNPQAFKLASRDNIDVLSQYTKAGKTSNMWHGTSIQCIEPKPKSPLCKQEYLYTSPSGPGLSYSTRYTSHCSCSPNGYCLSHQQRRPYYSASHSSSGLGLSRSPRRPHTPCSSNGHCLTPCHSQRRSLYSCSPRRPHLSCLLRRPRLSRSPSEPRLSCSRSHSPR